MTEVDQEGEILPDGTLSVYVAFSQKQLTFSSGCSLIMLLTMVLIIEKYNFLALAGMEKQFQSFISEQAIHQTTILQNQ